MIDNGQKIRVVRINYEVNAFVVSKINSWDRR